MAKVGLEQDTVQDSSEETQTSEEIKRQESRRERVGDVGHGPSRQSKDEESFWVEQESERKTGVESVLQNVVQDVEDNFWGAQENERKSGVERGRVLAECCRKLNSKACWMESGSNDMSSVLKAIDGENAQSKRYDEDGTNESVAERTSTRTSRTRCIWRPT